MLRVIIGKQTLWNTEEEKFIDVSGVPVDFEHSLVSVSKWEAKFKKAFLGAGEKSREEVIEYLKMMVISPEVSPELFDQLSQENLDALNEYIADKASATTFPHHDSTGGGKPPVRETVTAELIYYWMFSCGIPLECENWHLNRLLTLIRVFNVKNAKPKKLSRAEIAAKNRELNARRRAELGTSG